MAVTNFERYRSNHSDANSNYGSAHEPITEFRLFTTGNITADATYILGQVPTGWTGRIIEVIGLTQERGVDGAAALSMKYTVKKNTTAVCSTDPNIDKTAAAGLLSTATAGTGITQGVPKTDGSAELASKDILSILFDITRAGTPSPEIAGVGVIVRVKWYRR